jgi:prepilin signal peptidase PulO-like enzyme (type II secretory pathway)
MLRQMLFVMQTGVAEAVVGAAGLVVIAWLGSLVWRRQHWMLAPFQDRSLWTPRAPETTTLASGSRDEWLRIACLAFIAVLALQEVARARVGGMLDDLYSGIKPACRLWRLRLR